MFSGFRSLWAMPGGEATEPRGGEGLGVFQESLAGGLRGLRAGSPPTFVVQEVQGTGHVLHHHAGLQLVEVPALVDVAQDGAWAGGRAGHTQVTSESPQRPHPPPLWRGRPHTGFLWPKGLTPEPPFGQDTNPTSPLLQVALGPHPIIPPSSIPPHSLEPPGTSPHLLKHQVEAVLLLKELNQL